MATLENQFPKAADTTAIIVPGSPALTVTFKQLHEHTESFQSKLAAIGIGETTPVSIALPNSYAFIVSFLATTWQRGIAAPLNSAYKQAEFEFFLEDIESALLLVPQGSFEKNTQAVQAAKEKGVSIAECYWDDTSNEVQLDRKHEGKTKASKQDVLEAQPEDVALVLHTSGTTGRSKAVPLTHRNLVANTVNIRETYNLNEADRTMLIMPLFHVHGLLAGLLTPLLSKGSIIVQTTLTGSFWNDFITHKANWWTATPTLHQLLMQQSLPDGPLPTIRFIRSCSSPLNGTLLKAMESKFNTVVLEAYAMTEASHQMTSTPLPNVGPSKPGSVGRVHGNLELLVLDDNNNPVPTNEIGEIAIRGENVTRGYLNNPAANESSYTPDGFFRTGDQGKIDDDGYVTLTGRIKELINKGGEKISPIELDDVFTQHEAVSEAVSFAMPDELYGQDVGVAIVKKEGKELTEVEFRRWVLKRINAAKAPKKVFFTDKIPKTATGKIQRRMVAEAFLDKSE